MLSELSLGKIEHHVFVFVEFDVCFKCHIIPSLPFVVEDMHSLLFVPSYSFSGDILFLGSRELVSLFSCLFLCKVCRLGCYSFFLGAFYEKEKSSYEVHFDIDLLIYLTTLLSHFPKYLGVGYTDYSYTFALSRGIIFVKPLHASFCSYMLWDLFLWKFHCTFLSAFINRNA